MTNKIIQTILLLIVALSSYSCGWEDNLDNYGLGTRPDVGSVSLRGGTLFLDVKSNCQWNVVADEWCSVSPGQGLGDDILTVVIPGACEPREGKLLFTLQNGKVKETTIRQGLDDHIELIRSGEIRKNTDGSYHYKVRVIADAPWTSECEDWIVVTPNKSKKYKTDVDINFSGIGSINIKVEFKLANGTMEILQFGTNLQE